MSTVKLLFVLSIVLCYGKKTHKCSHNDVQQHIDLQQVTVNYVNHPYDDNMENSRRLRSSNQPLPIRINPYYDPVTISTDNGLTITQISYIKSLISTVIRYYHQFVYVVPIEDKLFFPRFCIYWKSTKYGINCVEYGPNQCGMIDVPNDHLSDDLLYFHPSNTTAKILPAGTGIADTDMIIYVSYAPSDSCAASTLAWAVPCVQDQFGRPVAGAINICPYMFEAAHYWKQDVVVLLHEITHVIIMSPELWGSFRDSNGGIIAHDEIVSSVQSDGLIYITSPSVAAFTRTHFNCSTLIGFPLENTGDDGSAGAHWDEHYAMSSLMGSTIWGGLQYFTGLTFALMTDSGWYFVDYRYNEPFYWGKNAGCSLYNTHCVDPETYHSNWPQLFCESPFDDGCAYNYNAPGYCQYFYHNEDLPWFFQYFSDSKHGGPQAADYCPFRDPNTHFDDFEAACWDLRGNTLVSRTYDSEIYGMNSRCVDIDNGKTFKGHCFEHKCFGYNHEMKEWNGVSIYIDNEESINCTRYEQPNGDILSRKYSSTQDIYITCPDIDSICGSTSRPFACFWGNWNEILSKCICSAGYVGDQCDIEDREIGFEVKLFDGINEATSSSQTLFISEVLCVDHFSNEYLNDEYIYDGIWNFYPRWKSENGLYIFWNIWNHEWMIFEGYDTRFYYAFCNVSEFTEDITDCNQYWMVYHDDTESIVLESMAVTYYGHCDNIEGTKISTSTPLPSFYETVSNAISSTTNIITTTETSKMITTKSSEINMSLSGNMTIQEIAETAIDIAAVVNHNDDLFDIGYILLISMGILILILLIMVMVLCGWKVMMKGRMEQKVEDESGFIDSGLGGGLNGNVNMENEGKLDDIDKDIDKESDENEDFEEYGYLQHNQISNWM